ncbi:MAG: hypothetical protein QXT47_01935 [Desulfurococcaceae archaeon]
MRRSLLSLYIVIMVFAIQIHAFTNVLSDVTVIPAGDLIFVNNGFIELTFDLSRGAAIRNIKAIHKDFENTPVYRNGIAAFRGGGPNIDIVAFDIISDNNPWYGVALGARSSYRIVKQTPNYTVLEFSYTLGSPFPGLKVVKTVKIPINSFIFYVNVTLENTGSSQITLDLSGPWGRPVGYMIEIVTKMGVSAADELRFVMFDDKTFDIFTPDETFVNYRYESRVAGIGIFDKSTDSSPWGFMLGVFCLDDATISKTYGIWLEKSAGGADNILNRIEFKAVTLNPGERVDYRLMFYAGPLHKIYVVDELGIPEDQYQSIFYDARFSTKPPGKEVKLELPYSVRATLELGNVTSLPLATIVIQDLGKINQVFYEINSSILDLRIWSNASYYLISIEPSRGFTIDEQYIYSFIGVRLPNGTFIEGKTVSVYLEHNWSIVLVFDIKPLLKIDLKLLTINRVDLPQQAGNLDIYLKTLFGEVIDRKISKTDSRVITFVGLVPGDKYVVVIPAEAGGYVINKVLINDIEKEFTIHNGQAWIVIDSSKATRFDIEVIYGQAGFIASMMYYWVAFTIALVIVMIIAVIIKKTRR